MAMTGSTKERGPSFDAAALSQFRNAIVAAGLTPPKVIEADGKLRRFSNPKGAAKGAKGATYFVCALLHPSRSLRVQATLERDSARREKRGAHSIGGTA